MQHVQILVLSAKMNLGVPLVKCAALKAMKEQTLSQVAKAQYEKRTV